VNINYSHPQHDGGSSNDVDLTYGIGSLAADGYNFMITGNFTRQQELTASQRSFANTGYDPTLGLANLNGPTGPWPGSYQDSNGNLWQTGYPTSAGNPHLAAVAGSCEYLYSAAADLIPKSTSESGLVSFNKAIAGNNTIAAGGTSLSTGTVLVYELQSNGSICQYQRVLCIPEGTCSSWVQLDNNPRAIAISANVSDAYQLHNDGSIWASNGVACSGTSCRGWQRLDDNHAAVGILARGSELYQLHNDGSIWIYTNVPCSEKSCPGWKKLDDNTAATAIAADGAGELYELRNDGSIWEYTHEACSGNSCPGWEKLDENPAAIAITADTRGGLYQLHNDGTIWVFTHEACSGNSCPGWEKLDENPLASSITSGGGILIQTHKSL